MVLAHIQVWVNGLLNYYGGVIGMHFKYITTFSAWFAIKTENLFLWKFLISSEINFDSLHYLKEFYSIISGFRHRVALVIFHYLSNTTC